MDYRKDRRGAEAIFAMVKAMLGPSWHYHSRTQSEFYFVDAPPDTPDATMLLRVEPDEKDPRRGEWRLNRYGIGVSRGENWSDRPWMTDLERLAECATEREKP